VEPAVDPTSTAATFNVARGGRAFLKRFRLRSKDRDPEVTDKVAPAQRAGIAKWSARRERPYGPDSGASRAQQASGICSRRSMNTDETGSPQLLIGINPHRVQLQTRLVASSSLGRDDATDPHTAWPPPGSGAAPLPFGADRSRGCPAGYATPLSAALRLPRRSRTGRANGSLWLWHLCRHQR
jgi:hypothetical protein